MLKNESLTGSQLNNILYKLVDSFVIDNNQSTLDEITGDISITVLSDTEQRGGAVDSLLKYIEHNREFI